MWPRQDKPLVKGNTGFELPVVRRRPTEMASASSATPTTALSSASSSTSSIHQGVNPSVSNEESVWYFFKQHDMCSEFELVLGTSSSESDPVSVSTSNSATICMIKRHISSNELKAGDYYVVLCLSMKKLLLKDVVEKITFSMQAGDGIISQISTSEYDINETPQSPDLRLRLHQGLEVFADTTRGYTLLITIAIRKTIGDNPSSFELRSLELNNTYAAPLPFKGWALFGTQRRPIHLSVCLQEADTPSAPRRPVKVSAIAISETGSHVATLWFHNGKAYITFTDMTLARSQSKGWQLNSAANSLRDSDCLRIAINRSGTQVAVFQSVTDSYLEDDGDIATHPSRSNVFPFTVLDIASGRTIPLPLPLFFSIDWMIDLIVEAFRWIIYRYLRIAFNGVYELLLDETYLRSFIGFGKFVSTPDGQELFVSCNGLSVEIHRIENIWSTLHKIRLQPKYLTRRSPSEMASHSDLVFARELTESAQGTYFTWLGDSRAASIWSVELGSMISFIPASSLPSIADTAPGALPCETPDTFSRSLVRIAPHGRFMAIARNNVVKKYLLPSGTLAGVLHLGGSLGPDCTILDISWSAHDFLVAYRDGSTHATYLAAFDIERRNMLNRWILPLIPAAHGLRIHEKVYNINGNTIDILIRDDLVKVPSWEECNDDCRQGFTGQAIGDNLSTQAYIVEGGNQYQLKVSESDDTVDLVLLTSTGDQQKQWRIVARDWRQLAEDSTQELLFPAFFIKGRSRFLVIGAEYVQLWQLPVTDSEPCRLVAIQPAPTSERETNGHYHGPRLTVCQHLRHLTIDYEQGDKMTIDMLHDRLVHIRNVGDLRTMVQLYTAFDDDPAYRDYRKAILTYIVQVFLLQPTWEDSKNVLLRELCEKWETEGFEGFLKDLVQHPDFKWIPTQSPSHKNPIAFGIKVARDNPVQNVQFHQTLIQHCVRNATREGDTFFLRPVLDCMSLIREDERLSLEVIWQLAFIPVPQSSRSFVLENSHPPGIAPWQFMSRWELSSRFNDKYRTFALRRIIGPYPEVKHIKDRLFVAPLAMLYRLEASADALDSNPYENHDRAWREYVNFEAHWVSQTTLENPALRAAVQHIWFLRGADVWLARAMIHISALYTLYRTFILHTVSAQALSISSLLITGAQRTYIMLSVIVTLIHHRLRMRRRNHASVRPKFNTSVLVVLASAVLQPFWPVKSPLGLRRALRVSVNAVTLVLIIAGVITNRVEIVAVSHLLTYFVMLYKFRVYQRLCRFLDFVYRFTADIGIFLVIFALGVVAFAEVFWILLRACLEYPCVTPNTNFPSKFGEAIFATYFFLGGRYDPVNDEMDGDLSMFHAVMALYYFFTAIIMLNVLIGLVNTALSKSIETDSWRLRWLSGRFDYVVLATLIESLTHLGRKKLAFEREVYYTATNDEIVEFQRKYMQGSIDFLLDRGVVEKGRDAATFVAEELNEVAKDVTEVISAADADAAAAKVIQDEELRREVADMKIMMAEMLRQMTDLSREIRPPKAIRNADNEIQEKEE